MPSSTPASVTPSPSPPPSTQAYPLPCVDSRALLAGARELLIRHGEELYRLRHTKNDKLILVK
jgi:hemin uptake protein HemP